MDNDYVTKPEVLKMIKKYAQDAQYGVSYIPYHEHTGSESPAINYVNIVGSPPSSGGVTLPTSSGIILADGTSTYIPQGWFSVRNSQGVYTITHNLGTTYYTLGFVTNTATPATYVVQSQGGTSFTVEQYDLSSNLLDNDFQFVLSIYSQPSTGRGLTMRFNVLASSKTVYIPYGNGMVGQIDWGDGSGWESVNLSGANQKSHTYANAGIYDVEFRGTMTEMGSGTWTNKTYLIAVLDWGDADKFGGFSNGGPASSVGVSFNGCTNLASLPAGQKLPKSGNGLYGARVMFQNCSSLTSIPDDFFGNHLNIVSYFSTVLYGGFESTFNNCSSLTSIPTDLFRYHTSVGTNAFKNCFNGCSSLTSIPTDLFRYNTGCTGYATSLFQDCTSLTSIPDYLFAYMPVTVFDHTFQGCTGLTSIPDNTFKNRTCTNGWFENCFNGCTSITTVPEILFKDCTGVTGFNPTAGSDTSNIGAFESTFQGCTSLATLPNNLFRYNTQVQQKAFKNTFNGCTSLNNLPTDLFQYNTQVSYGGFCGTFANCTSLSSIPTDIFRYNTLVSTSYWMSLPSTSYSGAFQSCFQNCTSLTSIPTDLFRYNTSFQYAMYFFGNTFYGCTGLTTVPTDLFRYSLTYENTTYNLNAFSQTFMGCTNLTTLPDGLFKYNTGAYLGTVQGSIGTPFSYTFNGCTKLQLNQYLFFDVGTEATAFLPPSGRIYYFNSTWSNTFYRTSFNGTQGTAPNMWDCDFGGVLNLNVAPATDWAPGDVITGQTSGATCVVIQKMATLTYTVKQRNATAYTLGEIIGVTGVPAKLADQGTSNPTITGLPTATAMFAGVGNNLTSLSNYASITSVWK